MQSAFHYKLDPDGVAHLVFDQPDSRVNLLTEAALGELEHWLDTLADEPEVRLLVIASAKPDVFIAGADIAEIAALTEPRAAAAKATLGQTVLQKLASFPRPTLAVIDGACLGGGLELALACTYRLASLHEKTRLGLPEVTLGVVPGFGGTQRLPALVGIRRALPMILTGKPLSGAKAFKTGLVDACAHRAFLYEQMTSLIGQVLTPRGRKAVLARRYGGWQRLLVDHNPLARAVICHLARRQVRRKTGDHYPAPLAAIDLLATTAGIGLEDGMAEEARTFGELACGPVARHLIHLYYLDERIRKEHWVAGDPAPAEVNRAAVIGAGVMGGGIAWLLADRGHSVRLKDISWDAVAKGHQAASGICRARERIGRTDPRESGLLMHRIAGTVDLSGLSRVDLAIEAVVEDAAVKRHVYADLESVLPPTAIIATNTSTIPIDELARDLAYPERFAGLHFFNPVDRMPLVEIIPGRATSAATIATLVAAARAWGKKPILVRSCPGFLVNRLLLPYLNEAVHLLVEGVPLERLDKLMASFGWPMGPMRLLDEIGLDVARKVAHLLEQGYGDRMAVHPFLDVLVDECGLHGRKSGGGFYLYRGRFTDPNPELDGLLLAYRRSHHTPMLPVGDDEAVDRLLLAMVNEASRALDERIVDDADCLDYALILGTGFPPHRGGLLRWADERGSVALVARLKRLAELYGHRFVPGDFLVRLAEKEGSFHETDRQCPQASIARAGGSVARDRVAPPQLHG